MDDQVVDTSRDVSIVEAARLLGISVASVRRRIRNGELRAVRVERAQGYTYRVTLPMVAGDQCDHVSLKKVVGGFDHVPVRDQEDMSAEILAGFLQDALADVRRAHARIEVLERERFELAGRLGYFQSEIEHLRAQLQAAETRILELEAPKNSAPAEISNHPTNFENAADSGSQEVSPRPWWQFWRSG